MTASSSKSYSTSLNLLWGFIAGFLATLIFHQVAAALLWQMGLAPGPPFQTAPRPPFGIPIVLSLAFWGGISDTEEALLEKHLGGYRLFSRCHLGNQRY